MAKAISLDAEARERAGKGAARATRRAGLIPAVIYGGKQPPLNIAIAPRAILPEIAKTGFRTHLYDLKIGKDTHRVLPRDVQYHPVTDRPEHIDFLRVSADTVVHVNVPVVFLNETKCPGLKRGGVLNIVRHDVELVCRPDDIPERLEIDLTGLDIGTSIHISSIKLGAGVRPAISDRDFTVATVAAPTVMKAADEEKAAATAEGAAAAPAAGAAAPAAGKAAAPAAGKEAAKPAGKDAKK